MKKHHFEFEDKGILGILDNKLNGRGQEEEDLCYVGFSEPTSVLDSVRSPLVSSSTTTLSSSHGGLNGIATVFSGADEMGFDDLDGVLSDFVVFDTGSGSDPVIDIQNPLFDYSFPFSEEEENEEVRFSIPTNPETPVNPIPSHFSVSGSRRLNSGQPGSNSNHSGPFSVSGSSPPSKRLNSGQPDSNHNNSVQPGSIQSNKGHFSVSGSAKRLNSGQPGSNFNNPDYCAVSGSGPPSKRLNSVQPSLNHNNSVQPGLIQNHPGQSGLNHNNSGQPGLNHNHPGQPGLVHNNSGQPSVFGSSFPPNRLNSGQPDSNPGYFPVTGSGPPSKRFNPGQPDTHPCIFPFSDPGQPGNETVTITNELITAAVELISNNQLLAQEILARLNHSLLNLNPKPPFHRAASYITEALHSLPLQDSSPPPQTLIPRIAAYKAFSETSPFLQFVNFTANQTILECVQGFESIHIVDFDIGFGGQWSSLIQELAKGRKKTRKSLKITAFVSDKFELRFTEDNLRTFAEEVGVTFDIEFLNVEVLLNQDHWPVSLLRSSEKEVVAVNLPISSVVTGYLPFILRFLREVSPKVVVCSDRSCDRNSEVPFPNGVINALQYYTSLLESIDCNNREVVTSIERFYVQPLIKKSLTNRYRWMERSPPWRSLFGQCGFNSVMVSRTAERQAEYLLQRSPMRGFHLEKGQSSLVLCWQKKELVAVSAWKCC